MNRQMHHSLALAGAGGVFARLRPRRLVRRTSPAPGRLSTTPPAFLAGDGARAEALYSGVFTFGQTRVDADGVSIFEKPAPDPYWAAQLHGFSFLADLAAAETALARAFARALVEDWAAARRPRAAHRPATTARRLINWLTYAPILLIDADPAFATRFLRLLDKESLRLKRRLPFMAFGLPRVLSGIALVQSALCLDDPRLVASASGRLAADLPRMILPDGGPATRNPRDLLVLTLDLLALRESFLRRDTPPPGALLKTLDRIWPMLRALRHADGTLALFNGMGTTDRDLLETALSLDDARGRAVLNAPHSGYQRLEGRNAVLVMDCGRAPPPGMSGEAHAGTLSFEFGTRAGRLIVNCGAPDGGSPDRRRAARAAAAHSTAVPGEASPARYLALPLPGRLLDHPLRSGPRAVDIAREDGPDATLLRASHDGHARRFGLVHERTLRLSADGSLLEGADVLKAAPGRRAKPAGIRLAFHLHPDLRAQPLEDGRSIALLLPDDDLWVFSAEDHPIALEESVFFADPAGPRRSAQIVIRPGGGPGARVTWSLRRSAPD